MNFIELQSIVKHLQKTCPCNHCKNKYQISDINIIAATKMEGLFELNCKKCNTISIVSVTMAPEVEINNLNLDRKHRIITKDDILDIKNFLNEFDGNFKKLFNHNTKK